MPKFCIKPPTETGALDGVGADNIGRFKLTGHCRDQPAERPTDGRAFGHDGVVSGWLQNAHLEKDRRYGGQRRTRIEEMNRAVARVAQRRGLPILPTYRESVRAGPRTHVGGEHGDCLHFCLPGVPSSWAAALLELIRIAR